MAGHLAHHLHHLPSCRHLNRLPCCLSHASDMSSGAERSVPAVGRPRLCWIIGLPSLRMRPLWTSWTSKSANCCRDASQPPPRRRWSTSCRNQAWKTPLGRALSVYEGARLRSPAHERRASVTAGFAYICAGQPCDRSRPFSCRGRGRERSAGRGGRLPRHSPLEGGRAPYEGAQQPPRLELGAFSPHSHDMPASPALSLCLRQPQTKPKRA